MNETNPNPATIHTGADLTEQLCQLRQANELRYQALMAALEAFRAEMRSEIAMLRARMLRRSA